MEKATRKETSPPEVTIDFATVEDEIKRVILNTNTAKINLEEKVHRVLPKGIDSSSSPKEVRDITQQEYDPSYYVLGTESMQSALPTILKAIETLQQFQDIWGFQLDAHYRIVLTRYGSGGSYDVTNKEIIVRTNQNGEFERGSAAATPIHEMTHLCVEHLVTQYNLPFQEKERLVNGIDLVLFPQIFDPNNTVEPEEQTARLEMLYNLPTILKEKYKG